MGRVSKAVGKLPFAGRTSVENAAMTAISERTSLKEKAQKAGSAVGILAVFAAIHGVQAKMGIDDMRVDYPELLDGDVTPMEAIEATVSTAYTLANSAVAYTQLQIAGRVGRNYLRFREQVNNGAELAEFDRDFEGRQATLTEAAATLGGQVTFLALWDK